MKEQRIFIAMMVLFIVLLFSCSPEKVCECEKEIYKEVVVWTTNDAGHPSFTLEYRLQYSETVVCQDETNYISLGHDQLYYKIKCN